MLSLLDRCTRSGYPPEYIISRIRGRMVTGEVHDLSSQDVRRMNEAGDMPIWDAAVDGYKWIYQQMDFSLREILAPLLFYFELDILVLHLRRLVTHSPKTIDGDVQKSLLARELIDIVMAPAAPNEVIKQLERFLAKSHLDMKELTSVFEKEGVQGCEELLRSRFLEKAPGFSLHPQVKAFFRRIIDLRNIMTIAKYLHWQKKEVPRLINGGHIQVMRADRDPSAAGVEKMVRRFTGGWQVTAEELHPINLETLLLKDLSKKMARQKRSGDPVVCCMGYAYHCYEASREKSKEYHAARFAEKFPAKNETVQ